MKWWQTITTATSFHKYFWGKMELAGILDSCLAIDKRVFSLMISSSSFSLCVWCAELSTTNNIHRNCLLFYHFVLHLYNAIDGDKSSGNAFHSHFLCWTKENFFPHLSHCKRCILIESMHLIYTMKDTQPYIFVVYKSIYELI